MEKQHPAIKGYPHGYGNLHIPSGNQTRRAGKWTIEIGDFPIKAPIQFGDFPLPCLMKPEGTVNPMKPS